MTINFDKIELDEAGAEALSALRGNEAFTKYVADAVAAREEVTRNSVASEYEPFKAKADEYKSKVDEFRQSNLTLKEQLEALNGIDPEEYKKLKQLGSGASKAAEQLERQELEYRGQLKDRDDKLTDSQKQLEELTAALNTTKQERESDAFKFDAMAAIQKYNAEFEAQSVRPKAMADLIDKMAANHKVIDGKRVMLYNGREFTTDAGIGSMDEWVNKVARSEYDYMFNAPTGGGAPGSAGSKAGPKQIARSEFNGKTPAEQRELIASGVVPVDQ